MGVTIGVVKGDTRSLDYSSYEDNVGFSGKNPRSCRITWERRRKTTWKLGESWNKGFRRFRALPQEGKP